MLTGGQPSASILRRMTRVGIGRFPGMTVEIVRTTFWRLPANGRLRVRQWLIQPIDALGLLHERVNGRRRA